VFTNEVFPLGINYILRAICGLDNDKEAPLIRNIKKAYEKITNEPKNWFNAVA
jgi:hypothetical protein